MTSRANVVALAGESSPTPPRQPGTEVSSARSGAHDEVVASDALLSRALALADFYAGKPPVAVQKIKQSVNRIVSAHDHRVMHMDAEQNLSTRALADQAEARAAYRESRSAALTGD